MSRPPSSSPGSPVGAVSASRLRELGPHVLIVATLAVLTVLVHLRFEYVILTVFWAGLTVGGPRSRRFSAILVPVLIVGVMYDLILPRLLPYRGAIHIADLFHAELALFGIHTPSGAVIPSEWLAHHTSPILDLACGVAYMTYMFETFAALALVYVARDVERTAQLAWAFLMCNVVGMTLWLVFPAAPPWYVAQYGLGPPDFSVLPSAAGAARFDALVGWHYFQGFYTRSHNVFGAMPSLHAAYPTVVLLSVWTVPRGWVRTTAALFAILVAFAAVYLYHHYVLDVLAGVIIGLGSYSVVWLIRR